jgi:type III pantothenate kinase
MLLVIDIGNTRTKWALANDAGELSATEICLNTNIDKARFSTKQVSKVLISNVAGDAMAQQITQILSPMSVHFAAAKKQACGLTNQYENTLGTDRWAALVAAWKITKHATVVVNAGTAITIDAIAQNKKLAKEAVFLGGTIQPGLHLMHAALSQNTAQLKCEEGKFAEYPQNTPDAIETGCLNAIVGAIHLMLKRLEKHSGWLPKLVISGGDAQKIAQALNPQGLNLGAKQVIIENLVLRGLVALEKETLEKETIEK